MPDLAEKEQKHKTGNRVHSAVAGFVFLRDVFRGCQMPYSGGEARLGPGRTPAGKPENPNDDD